MSRITVGRHSRRSSKPAYMQMLCFILRCYMAFTVASQASKVLKIPCMLLQNWLMHS